jgi:hypothetical protein
MLIWLENSTFAAWACAACDWFIPNPGVSASSGSPLKKCWKPLGNMIAGISGVNDA